MAGKKRRTERVRSGALPASLSGNEQIRIEIHRGVTLFVDPARAATKNPAVVKRHLDGICDCLTTALEGNGERCPVEEKKPREETDE